MDGLAIPRLGRDDAARLLTEVRQRSSLALAVTVVSMLALTAMRASGTGPIAVTRAFQLLLVVSFVALALLDLRRATLVALFELALAGASGRWAELPGGISGRIFVDSVVVAGGAAALARDALRGERHVLGRYGGQALALAIAFPVVWMTIGLVEGNARSDVWNDGDGLVFFAFALVIVWLVRRGSAAWLRRAFFAACVANAILTGALFALGASGAVSAGELRNVLEARLEMGGGVGHMPNGAFRLYLGSGLYLQLGLALVLWRLLRSPRSLWLWTLNILFWVDVYATYTRGLWVAAALAAVVVLAVGTPNPRLAALVAGATAAVLALAVGAATAAGVSLASYVTGRVASITASGTPLGSSRPTPLQNGSFERDGGWRASPGLAARPTSARAFAGERSVALVGRVPGADSYLSQQAYLVPHRLYRFTAMVDAGGLRAAAAGQRGLLVWDVSDGLVYTARLPAATHGWRRLSVVFGSPSPIRLFQFRLYAPEGTVYWDDAKLEDIRPLHLAELHLAADPHLPITGASLLDPGFESKSEWRLHRQDATSRVRYAQTPNALVGRRAGTLTNARAGRDDYLFQTIPRAPRHLYTVRAWVDAAGVAGPAAGGRGLLAWDAANGVTWSAPLVRRTSGWARLSLTFVTGPAHGPLQIRLYAPRGSARWDDVHVVDRGSAGDPPVVVAGLSPPPSSAGVDTAGEISNRLRIEQAKVLWRHVERRPVLGSGFGAIAADYPYRKNYAYELTYLALLFKTGFVGLLLYLSFPLRMIRDAIDGRRGRLRPADGVVRQEAALVVAFVASVLVAGATNPYLLAAFGLWPILISIAWLQPGPDPAPAADRR